MIKSATSAYVDDILINENLVPASHIQPFLDYGLVSKDLVRLRDGARVLGLQVWEKDGTPRWKQGSQILKIPDGLTRQCVFSLYGKLVGTSLYVDGSEWQLDLSSARQLQ